MSEPSLPPKNGQHKPPDEETDRRRYLRSRVLHLPLFRLYPGDRVIRANGDLMIPEFRPGSPLPAPKKKPRSSPKRPTGKAADTYSPLQHMLDSIQAFGFVHPNEGNFLQLPKQFQALMALETKAVANVVLEVMLQTIGWETGREPGGRREWIELTVRHFVGTRLLSRSQTERGIKRALAKGYIQRRQIRKRRFEYAIRWSSSNEHCGK